jgi:hypothetical protein
MKKSEAISILKSFLLLNEEMEKESDKEEEPKEVELNDVFVDNSECK